VPPAPVLQWPANADTALYTPVDLKWAPVSGALGYYVMVFHFSAGFPNLMVSSYSAIPAFVAVLPPGGPYAWVVWAHGASGWSPPSEVRWFRATLNPFAAHGWVFVKRVVVAATATWVDTGVDLGEKNLGLVAVGRTQPTTPAHPAYLSGFGPEGAEFPAGLDRPLAPLRSAPFMALVGRIGAAAGPFYVGRARNCGSAGVGVGRLYLRVNDDYHSDNQGALYVEIWRQR